jgi:transcriptional regulator with XRE-family HTH domain
MGAVSRVLECGRRTSAAKEKTTVKTIRELREEKGWTQLEVAYRAKVTPATVSNWERGVYEPKVSQLRTLARLFGVKMDDITLIEEPVGAQGKAAA